MKRFTGWILAISGAIAAGWGAVSVMTGSSGHQVSITSTLSVSALVIGLAGLATLTIGLVWIRD